MISESGFNVRYYARRIARSNEHIGRFLDRAEQTAFFGDRVELPALRGVPGEIAAPTAAAWADWWMSEIDSRGRAGDDAERCTFRDWLVDGEIFIDFPDGMLRPVPSDLVPDQDMAADDFRVDKWTLQSGLQVDADDLLHVAIIKSNWQVRGRSWLARAIPVAYPHMEFRDNAGTAIQQVSKIAAVRENQDVGSAHRLPAVDGAGGYDAFETLDAEVATSLAGAVRRMQAGVVQDLKAGEKMAMAEYGPPPAAITFSDDQIPLIATALGVSESELTGDHVKHNFASLQVAEVRDLKTYDALRKMWYQQYRRPLWRRWLDIGIANGTVPSGATKHYKALRNPRWSGPRIMSAQPVKDAQAIKEMASLGLINLRQMGASQGENVTVNAEQNAEIMGMFGNAAPPDVGEAVGEAIKEAS